MPPLKPKKTLRSQLIIAIDGPAGSGKSSTAKAFAQYLKLPYIDTGAMYRAVTLKAVRLGIPFKDAAALARMAKKTSIRFSNPRYRTPSRGDTLASSKNASNVSPRDGVRQLVYLDGKDVTDAIRDSELTKNVFYIAQIPAIRREMVKKQRVMGLKAGGVMEGRDIGTKVFPDADFKFFFEANPRIRARRRQKELEATGKKLSLEAVLADIQRRDKTDQERKEGPLRRAHDAILIDTSELTIDETIDKMAALMVRKPLKGRKLSV